MSWRFPAASLALHALLAAALWLWPAREAPRREVLLWATPLELAEAGAEAALPLPPEAPPALASVADAPALPAPATAPAPPPLPAPADAPALAAAPPAPPLEPRPVPLPVSPPLPEPPAARAEAPRLPPLPDLADLTAAAPPAPPPVAPPAPEPPPPAPPPTPLPPGEAAEAPLPLPPRPPPAPRPRPATAAAGAAGVQLQAGLAALPAGETRAPRPLDRGCADAIAYPPEAARLGLAGSVRLTLRIGDDGRVVATEVTESSGLRLLDEAARRGVERCRFEPALRDGLPVFGTAAWRVTFVPPR